jgi:hypothetical protein
MHNRDFDFGVCAIAAPNRRRISSPWCATALACVGRSVGQVGVFKSVERSPPCWPVRCDPLAARRDCNVIWMQGDALCRPLCGDFFFVVRLRYGYSFCCACRRTTDRLDLHALPNIRDDSPNLLATVLNTKLANLPTWDGAMALEVVSQAVLTAA